MFLALGTVRWPTLAAVTLTCSQHHVHAQSAALHVPNLISASIALPAAYRQAAGARTALAASGDLSSIALHCASKNCALF